MLLVLLACNKDAGDTAATDLVPAVVDPARTSHFFDAPFPDDGLRTSDGGVDLTGYPTSEGVLAGIIEGWTAMAAEATRGFSANMPAYFRFEGPLELPESTDGASSDPVLWLDLDDGALYPLDLAFVADPLDDPYWAENMLAAAPSPGHTPPSGHRIAAVVMESAGATSPDGYELDAEVQDALDAAGVVGTAAVATTFTVQDSASQLQALHAAARDWWETSDVAAPEWKRVVELAYAPGETESGEPTTIQTVTFEDGTTEEAFLAEYDTPHTVELGDDWPMAVYAAELAVPYFQGLEGRPWMSPGVGMLLDSSRRDGWIHFDADGALTSVPDTDTARIVISLPKTDDGVVADAPLVIWDHGTGGTAYNHVFRKNGTAEQEALTALFAEAGVALLSRDQPLYGTRYPLVDAGFTDGSLGFYNIGNLPVFRDNQRQGGVEGEVLRWFAEGGLNATLPEGSVDPTRIGRFGHSLGSVTANNGMAASGADWPQALLSGAGSIFALNFLESGLAGTGHGLFDTLATLFGLDPADADDLGYMLAAAMGIEDEDARRRVDRLHPAIALFQWIVDPSDPSTFGHTEDLPVTVIMGIGDWQVPNRGTEALVSVLPDATLAPCEPLADYDPHHCLFREAQALDLVGDWLDGL